MEVQNRVNQALGRMPADVRTNGISVTKNTAGFMGGIGFFSADNRYDSLFISNYIDLYVKDAIKRVPGVGNVIIFGERRFAMRLWLDPTKLASRGLTPGGCPERAAGAERSGCRRSPRRRPGERQPDLHPQRSRDGPAVGGVGVRQRRRLCR